MAMVLLDEDTVELSGDDADGGCAGVLALGMVDTGSGAGSYVF